MFYNKLTACNKTKGEGEGEGERRQEGEIEGNSFSIAYLALNHPTWECRRDTQGKVEG